MNNLMKRGNHTSATPATTLGSLVDNLFQDNLSRFFDDDFWDLKGLRTEGVPVNIRETANDFELQVIAPGVKKEDFRINISDDMLTVNFEHRTDGDHAAEKEGWLRREYRYESFSRSFPLNDTIDRNKITARYQDGILYVKLPKKEGAQKMTRSVQVQ
jgi:HSP20 family protein